MNSPLTAQAWEIWQRGRRSALCVIGCFSVCGVLNLVILRRLHLNENGWSTIQGIFGLLMTLSFLFLMGIFNYTEYSSAKDWNGFPYRLFVLPVRTWQLVAMPMLLCVAFGELLYFGWVKLIWTHSTFEKPEWFAVLLGAYAIFYQTTLWTFAGLRITRMLVLSFGGVSCIAVAWLPFSGGLDPSPWLSEKRLIPVVIALALIAFIISWGAVARQRSGGGRRRSRFKALGDLIIDVLPRRTRDFASPAAAQFWFEWRRTGFLLPASTAFVLVAIFGPVTWMFRADEQFTITALFKILATPLVLGFAIGKGFVKPEFWSMNLALPPFLAVRPIPSGEFVISKLKVAALSVALTWVLVVAFILTWLFGWANPKQLLYFRYVLQTLFPHSWILLLSFIVAAFAVLTWRCLVSGLWAGLAGKRSRYVGAIAVQILAAALIPVPFAIWADNIYLQFKNYPDRTLSVIGWSLAFAVIAKAWSAAFCWRKIDPARSRQYLLLWSSVTLGFVLFAILATQMMDTYRLEHLCILAALMLFPLTRLGLAPGALSQNRHR